MDYNSKYVLSFLIIREMQWLPISEFLQKKYI